MSNLQHMLWMVDRKWGATKVKEIRGKEEFLDKLVWCERRMKNNLNWLISLLSGVKNENWNRTERTWCLNATSADIFQLTFFKTGQDTLQPKSGKFQQGDRTVSTCASGNERRWFQREIGTLCSREAGIFNETCHWQQNQILLKKGQDIKFLYNDRTLATFIQPIVLPTTFSLINASWGDSWNKWHPIDNEKCFECWKYKSRQTAELFTFRGREINLIFGSGNGDTSALEDQKPWNPYVEKKGFGYGSERSESWMTVWWTAAEQVCDLLSFRVHIIRECQTQQVISESLRSADSHYKEATQASSSLPSGRRLGDLTARPLFPAEALMCFYMRSN